MGKSRGTITDDFQADSERVVPVHGVEERADLVRPIGARPVRAHRANFVNNVWNESMSMFMRKPHLVARANSRVASRRPV